VIDIHAHILPGLDDGPQDFPEALRVCQAAVSDGIKAIVCTPHIGRYNNSLEKIIPVFEHLKSQLRKAAIELQLFLGADILFSPQLPQLIRTNHVVSINNSGRYILIEFPHYSIPEDAAKTVFDLLSLGVTPIVTHPERNSLIQRHPAILYEFINQGALAQLTAASITGLFGRHAERAAYFILEHNLAQVIATDVHSLEGRGPYLRTAVDVVAGIVGEDLAWAMVTTVPQQIIDGKPVDFPEPIRP
jgi:protein-tyrosine phosphatase